MYPFVHSSAFYNSQDLETASVDEWIKKTGVPLPSGILLSREKEGACTLYDSLDGIGEHYAK